MKITWDVPSSTATSLRLAVLRLAEEWVRITLIEDYSKNPAVVLKTDTFGTPYLNFKKESETVSFGLISVDAYAIRCIYQRSRTIAAGVTQPTVKAEISIYKKMPTGDRIDVLASGLPSRNRRETQAQIVSDLSSLLIATGIVKS